MLDQVSPFIHQNLKKRTKVEQKLAKSQNKKFFTQIIYNAPKQSRSRQKRQLFKTLELIFCFYQQKDLVFLNLF